MAITFSGPMFEPSRSEYWKSVSGKSGGHYNNFGCRDEHGMAALRDFFKTGEADEMNFVLFSTSGVHGTYTTIEDAEQEWRAGVGEDGEPSDPCVTFLVVQPRICTGRHGNCRPESADDFVFLKKVRESSWRVVQKIGREE